MQDVEPGCSVMVLRSQHFAIRERQIYRTAVRNRLVHKSMVIPGLVLGPRSEPDLNLSPIVPGYQAAAIRIQDDFVNAGDAQAKLFLPCLRVEKANLAARRADGQTRSIQAERRTGRRKTRRDRELLSADAGIPNRNRVIPVGSDDLFAIRAELEGADIRASGSYPGNLIPSCGIEDGNRPVRVASRQKVTISVEPRKCNLLKGNGICR